MYERRVDSALTKHAWNHDGSMLAIVPNNNTLVLLKTPQSVDQPWTKVASLAEHDALITDVAWAPKSNKIVTTSQDRNAYVWTQADPNDPASWKPMLVILRIPAAATSVRWSPDETKFAVGSGAKVVPVCYYESENNFWVSKMIKEHESTIVAVEWHPSAPIVATASTDMRCRVISAYLKNLDSKESAESQWGPPVKFGTVLYAFAAHAWVNAVAFSPSGDALAIAVHNSTVTLVDTAAAAADPAAANATQTLRLSTLPLSQLLFLPDGTLVGAGHTFDPVVFKRGSGGLWSMSGRLVADKGARAKEEGSGVAATRRMFQSQAATGTGLSSGVASAAAAALETVHQFPTCGLALCRGAVGGVVCEFSTSSLDGKLVGWSRGELSAALQAMSLAT